jgi:hypothetical protein
MKYLLFFLVFSCASHKNTSDLQNKSQEELISAIPKSGEGKTRLTFSSEEYLLNFELAIDQINHTLTSAFSGMFSGEQLIQFNYIEKTLSVDELNWSRFLQNIFKKKNMNFINPNELMLVTKALWAQALIKQELVSSSQIVEKDRWCIIKNAETYYVAKLCFSQFLSKSFTKIEMSFESQKSSDKLKQEWFF